MDKTATPPLLPILRSQQQGEILTLLLGDPDLELSLTDIATQTGVPYPSVHREIERAEQAGILTSRKIGNTRLTKANTTSPYYNGLADILTKAFGPPTIIAHTLAPITGISAAYIYGSWAAQTIGQQTGRPIGDLDVLILGNADRDEIYAAMNTAEQRLGREIQVTLRNADWLQTGSGSFHANLSQRPLIQIPLNPPHTNPAGSTQ